MAKACLNRRSGRLVKTAEVSPSLAGKFFEHRDQLMFIFG